MATNQIEITAFEAIHALQACKTSKDLHETFMRFISNFGFTHYVISEIPPIGFKPEPHVLIQNWPDAWYHHYIEKGHYDHDPVVRNIENTMQPQRWRDIVHSKQYTPRQKRVMLDAAEFGLNDGYMIPIYGASHLLNCVSLSGEQLELPPPAPDALHMVSMYAHEASRTVLEAAMPRVKKKDIKLTRREREILKWVAKGKTDAEIAVICNISHKTAGHHVSSAIHKMDAVNRAQAVAHAILARQIVL